MATETYSSCCGKSVCTGCLYSLTIDSGKISNCPFCNSDRDNKTEEEEIVQLMKRVEANDVGAIHALAGYYQQGTFGLQQDKEREMELWKQAAALGSSQAHCQLGIEYDEGGDLKKAKFHFEVSAMAGHEVARCNLGAIESESGNMDRALKHWVIAASAGYYKAMFLLKACFEEGFVSRESIESTLTAYNTSCAEIRSEARDSAMRLYTASNGAED
jgi:TPR repeat protein